MFNFFIIMDEIQGNNIARNFSSEYFNYTINFIISKEFPALTNFPDFSLILCDLDKNIELAKKHNLPVIAFSQTRIPDGDPVADFRYRWTQSIFLK